MPSSGSHSQHENPPVAAAAWSEQLERGTTEQRMSALRQLIEHGAEAQLVGCLSSANPAVGEMAIAGLWECWLDEAGADARRALERATERMNDGEMSAALAAFEGLAAAHPQWAEPVNKIATALYLEGKAAQSLLACQRVVALKPDHFGAWNGMAICAIQIEDWGLALRAVEESLRLQPHSEVNAQLLDLVRSRLRAG